VVLVVVVRLWWCGCGGGGGGGGGDGGGGIKVITHQYLYRLHKTLTESIKQTWHHVGVALLLCCTAVNVPKAHINVTHMPEAVCLQSVRITQSHAV